MSLNNASSLNNKWVLVTGASSGIGWEFAKVFANSGYNIVAVARRKDRLFELSNEITKKSPEVKVITFPLDLTKNQSPANLFTFLDKKKIKIDVIVNNAGFGLGGYFKNTNLEKELLMIDLNIKALVSLSKEYLSRVDFTRLDTSRGIINISSIASFMVGPEASIYYASKAFVTSFSKSLAMELRDTLTITAVCPGLTRTEFDKVSKMNEKQSKIYELFYMSAKSVAEIGYKAFRERKVVEVTGIRNKIALFFLKLFNLAV